MQNRHQGEGTVAKQVGIFSIWMLILLTSGLTYAQDVLEDIKKMSPEENAELMTDWMKSALALDESQAARVHDINLNYAKKNREIVNSGERKLRLHKQLSKSSKEKDGELSKILTKEQYRMYQEKKEDMKAKMKQKMKEKRR
jgi:hypothetical protein